jgi:dolichyl-phosphate beta-glucosyltransferase
MYTSQGHAVKRGMLCARGERCLMMDADGATKFSDLDMLDSALTK